MPEAEESDPEPWFIFNDFAVQNITEEEALSIPSGWKVCPLFVLLLGAFLTCLFSRFRRSCTWSVSTLFRDSTSAGCQTRWIAPSCVGTQTSQCAWYKPILFPTDLACWHRNRDPRLIKHEPLRFEELPKPGTLIAIDAEFVSMQQEETEYRSDGTKKVIRPARLSLARVSVLRGDGPKEGVPFIDDHIHTSEIIVDYLTEFSGIKCKPLFLLNLAARP